MRNKHGKIILMMLLALCILVSCNAFKGEAGLMDRIAKDYEEYYYQQLHKHNEHDTHDHGHHDCQYEYESVTQSKLC